MFASAIPVAPAQMSAETGVRHREYTKAAPVTPDATTTSPVRVKQNISGDSDVHDCPLHEFSSGNSVKLVNDTLRIQSIRTFRL